MKRFIGYLAAATLVWMVSTTVLTCTMSVAEPVREPTLLDQQVGSCNDEFQIILQTYDLDGDETTAEAVVFLLMDETPFAAVHYKDNQFVQAGVLQPDGTVIKYDSFEELIAKVSPCEAAKAILNARGSL